MSLRLLIADDHALVRAGIRSLLERTIDGVEILDAIDGHDAVSVALRERPDIVLMDISMPGLNGLEATRRLTSELPDTKILILSMHRDEEHVVQAMRAGASGYLIKDAAVEEVGLAIARVQNGAVFISPKLPKVVSRLLSASGPKASPLELLSGRQREILQLIAEGESTKEIAYRLNVSGKTIETHRRQLMQRLEIYDVAGLARFAVRAGLVTADR
jgi:DNA-binding NarL/FixJ family response regulator